MAMFSKMATSFPADPVAISTSVAVFVALAPTLLAMIDSMEASAAVLAMSCNHEPLVCAEVFAVTDELDPVLTMLAGVNTSYHAKFFHNGVDPKYAFCKSAMAIYGSVMM